MMRVISLGAGVQSTAMALMAAHGEIGPMPDCAIFADTGWEPKTVYEHLDRLETMLPFPVHRVSAGNLRSDAITGLTRRSGRFTAIPWFIRNADGSDGMGKRECTSHYKLEPIQRKIVAMHGGKRPKGGTEMWIGISTDEAMRMKPSRVQYIVNRWPLIERLMNRRECMTWLERNGFAVPPKSACIGCPFHSNEHWRQIRAGPIAWADALEVDKIIRKQAGFKGQQFMHSSRKPLDQVDLRTHLEAGQPDLFMNECEGMCGV